MSFEISKVINSHLPGNLSVGIDIGSTTAKIAILNPKAELVFSRYTRHNTQINQTLIQLLEEARRNFGNIKVNFRITGSAGIGVSEKTGIPFVQEVIAAAQVVQSLYPDVKTLIDIGGEDSKMIFFSEHKSPDIRMNGSCAGGTGAFIDQMASLMNVELSEFNNLASKSDKIHTIASRCGVFAKTDIQNLLSRKINLSEIAASVFHAVAMQSMNTLARGFDIVPKVMFAGGPFCFMPELTRVFLRDLKLEASDVVHPENQELLPAIGTALAHKNALCISFSELIVIIQDSANKTAYSGRLKPLFNSRDEFKAWENQRISFNIPKIEIKNLQNLVCYLGIDSGSTTTKICVLNSNKELIFSYYANSKGNPIETALKGLKQLESEFLKEGLKPDIKSTAVVGYGEDLVKSAFNIDYGMVETIAHFTAARYFNKDVSFIMDIGGQDMKAIFVSKGLINRIELNESCSAGCGSFIETFGNSLGYKVDEFAAAACHAKAPSNLGTRCTVFMNSKVKQSLRENATVADIAAGLSVSVIKNALYKVLKLKDISELGNHIVVQGGAFRNPSVLKALEIHTGKKVICSDMPEMMGAFGAAVYAQEMYEKNGFKTKFRGLENLDEIENFNIRNLQCKGCENNCQISKFTFWNGNDFFSGNKCEKNFFNKGNSVKKGFNFFNYKYNLLFNRELKPHKKPVVTLGIPRVLNVFENFPFWNTLFTECGINVVLSDPSTMDLHEKGLGTVMSDNICFPAKIVHGHIFNFSEKKIDRIFFPIVIYENDEFSNSDNSFNCPLVSSYSDVIKSSINPHKNLNLPFDQPVFNLKDNELLEKACYEYLHQFGIQKKMVRNALKKAYDATQDFKLKIKQKGNEIILKAAEEKRLLFVLAGRPYHTDQLINQKTPEMLCELGVDVISEDAVPLMDQKLMADLQVITQWAYTNRIYNAAKWVANQDNRIQFVQVNSFGCGPDSIVIDECVEILKEKGKAHTLIRVDEITSTGSVRLRLRSLVESVKMQADNYWPVLIKRSRTPEYKTEDKKKLIIGPYFAYIYSEVIPSLFKLSGYHMITLSSPDDKSVKFGLKYANNEICFPATIVVGDVIKALSGGNYDNNNIAVAITQTGGQCRASTYLALIKKGMIAAGFGHIPVVSLGTSGKTINPQEGFKIEWKKILPVLFSSILYADSLSKMYHVAKAREKVKGSSKILTDRYLNELLPLVESNNVKGVLNKLKEAVDAFNQLDLKEGEMPAVGIVGEIYIKYSSFGHQYIVDWLIEQGVEVVIPPILDFFVQEFVNYDVNKKANLSHSSWSDIFIFFFERKANRFISRFEKINAGFKFHRPFHKIRHIAQKASEIVDLTAQFGEGWLIPAEIALFAEDRINNVISVQPFGCIANHVVSKGVEKRIKDLFPRMNLLFLDFDADTSEVNVLNRLHFMVENVRSMGN
ncbi:MAG: acyl-CoA dehydratase activase [Bacteroidales bacterium]